MSLRASSGRTQFWGLTIQKGPWKETRSDKRNEMTSLGNKTFFGGGVQGAGKIHAGHAGAFTAMDPVGTPNWGNYPQPMPGPSRYAQAEVTTSSAPTQYTRQLPPGKQYLQTKANLLGLPKGSIQQAGAVARPLEHRTPAAIPGPENADADTMNTEQLVRDQNENEQQQTMPGAFPAQEPNLGPIVTGFHPVSPVAREPPLISHTFGVQTEQPQFSNLAQQTDHVLEHDDLVNALYEVNAQMENEIYNQDQNVRWVLGSMGFDPNHNRGHPLTGANLRDTAIAGHMAVRDVLNENGYLRRQLYGMPRIEEVDEAETETRLDRVRRIEGAHDEQVDQNTGHLIEQSTNTAHVFENLRRQSLHGHDEDLPPSFLFNSFRTSKGIKRQRHELGQIIVPKTKGSKKRRQVLEQGRGAKTQRSYFAHEYRGGDPAQGGSVVAGNPVGNRRKNAQEIYMDALAQSKPTNLRQGFKRTKKGKQPLSLKEMAAERVRLQGGPNNFYGHF